MNSYKMTQLDADGTVLAEHEVVAFSYNAALKQLKEVADDAQRIEVHNHEGDKVGAMHVDYWQQMRHK